MALTVISENYERSETGLQSLINVISGAFPWDEIDTSITDGAEFYKDLDSEKNKRVSIRLNGYSDYGFNLSIRAYVNGSIFEYTSYSGTYAGYGILNIVFGDGIFSIAGNVSKAFPYYSSFFRNIGISTAKNVETGETGYAAWVLNGDDSGMSAQRLCAVLGGSTLSGDGTVYFATVNSRLLVAQRMVSAQTVDVPDKVLRIECTPDSHFNTVGYCVLNGTRYYKNGAVLIPAGD